MKQNELIPHLFRTEFSKITAVLCKLFGIQHIEMAEDIAGETFLAALETWTYKGIPENPTAWLYTVAKNKAKNQLHHNNIFSKKIATEIKQTSSAVQEIEIDLSAKNISDSQLQMLFAVCHPSISAEAQIGLALRILCGFGIEEIANAFLTGKETINKRLTRAREKLRNEKVQMEFPGAAEIDKRLQTVLTTLYLLFNEGYYSESNDAVLREDLCLEAMRLTYQLIKNESTNLPKVHALFSLMCFHASRFEARKNDNGQIILFQDQDESLWNEELITKGAYHLHEASQGTKLSQYHLEASIAYWHTKKTDSKARLSAPAPVRTGTDGNDAAGQEKWETILQLYNRLLQINYSPVAALSRTYALAKTSGKHAAIEAAEKLQLTDNHFYFVLLGELFTGIDNSKAKKHFEKAVALATTQADKKHIQQMADKL
jgi:RNA polymerase sigma factor (sigma-70 family)